MAGVAEAHFGAEVAGVAVVPHGANAGLHRLEVIEAGHPSPDEASLNAARRLIMLATEAKEVDLILVMLSGGASSLASLPGEGLSLGDKRAIGEKLLRSGATIGEINCVRRHLSRIKGGRLALTAAPARTITLAISDVPDDRPENIGSGPTVADPTTLDDARAVLKRYRIAAPTEGWSETPKAVDSEFRIVAGAKDAMAAAAAAARRLGYNPVLLGSCTGDAEEVGRRHAELALGSAPGTALVSGGELSVRVTGSGSGGRNQHYAIAAALRLAGRKDAFGLAGDSDGVDGMTTAAGAFFDGTTASEPDRAQRALALCDSGGFFASRGDQLVTGLTGTNVGDLRIILIAP